MINKVIKRKKEGNTIIILFSLIIFISFISIANCYPKNSKRAENISIGRKLELEASRMKLIDSITEGADQQKVIALADKINNLCELVIVGKIIGIETVGAEKSEEINFDKYFNLEVESVKRGNYSYDKIKIIIGQFSDKWSIPLYPVYLKTNYCTGDRIKVYLDNFEEFGCYAAPAGFFGIHALN